MNRLPSRRNTGHRWVNSPRAGSTVVSAVTGPPVAATFQRPDTALGAKTMVPCELQAPPRGLGASARIIVEPPTRSSRWSLLLAKKPTDLASGDQKGY